MYLAACGPTHVWPDLTIRMWSDWKTAVPPAGGSIISLYIFIQHMYITFYTPASLNKSVFELWAGPVPVMWNLGSIKYFKPYLIPDLYLKKNIYIKIFCLTAVAVLVWMKNQMLSSVLYTLTEYHIWFLVMLSTRFETDSVLHGSRIITISLFLNDLIKSYFINFFRETTHLCGDLLYYIIFS